MVLPILAVGLPMLRQSCTDITPDFSDLPSLIASMWETMDRARGVGLAAPQVGRPLRLFVVDSRAEIAAESAGNPAASPPDPGIRQVFINARIIDYSPEVDWETEGCLSIPGIRERIRRPVRITIAYCGADFRPVTETYRGITARMIQHEYDHIEGKLLLDHLSPLKRQLLAKKLQRIRKGQVGVSYPMRFR